VQPKQALPTLTNTKAGGDQSANVGQLRDCLKQKKSRRKEHSHEGKNERESWQRNVG
jgi:hypothetical protein